MNVVAAVMFAGSYLKKEEEEYLLHKFWEIVACTELYPLIRKNVPARL